MQAQKDYHMAAVQPAGDDGGDEELAASYQEAALCKTHKIDAAVSLWQVLRARSHLPFVSWPEFAMLR